MGKMTKKRSKPRIVRKNKRHESKIKKGLVPKATDGKAIDSRIWDNKRTVLQNFASMGLVKNNKPSMRQTNEGKALLTTARVRLNKAHYAKMGVEISDEEEIDVPKDVPTVDLMTLFPEIKPAA